MFQVHMFLVGVGDSFLIEAGDTVMSRILIDTGTSAGWKANILPILKKNSSTIDLRVITHIDCDHIGGAVDLFSKKPPYQLEIKEVWFNELRQMIQYQLCERGYSTISAFTDQKIRWKYLWPLGTAGITGY